MEDSGKAPPLLFSCRFTQCIFCFLALVQLYLIRFNFSMAIVCMTGSHSANDTNVTEAEFSWDKATIGHLLSAFFYGYLVTQVLGGWISDRFGTKTPSCLAMLLLSVSCLVQPLSARLHFGCLIGCRVLQGVVSGFLFPVVYSSASVWSSPAERGTFLAIMFAGVSVCNIINFPLSALLCATGVDGGWPMIFYLPGVTGLIWTIMFYLLTSNTPEDHPRISQAEKNYLLKHRPKPEDMGNTAKRKVPWKDILTSKCFCALCVTETAIVFLFYVITINLPIYINDTLNLGIVNNGLLSSVPYIAYLIMGVFGKIHDVLIQDFKLSKNVVRKSLGTIGMVLPSVLLPLLSSFPSVGAQVALVTLSLSSLQICMTAGHFVSYADMAGSFVGSVFGLANTIANSSGFVIPTVVAALTPNGTKDEWQKVFLVSSVVGLVGAISYLFFGSNDLQPWAKQDQKETVESTNA